MDGGLARAIEAIVMVAEDPVPPTLLAQLLEVPVDRVEAICSELAAGYEVDSHGFVLARVAGGYRFQSHPELAPYVERFVVEGQSARLSAAALETLAIVAYKQPITKVEIDSIRGVDSGGALHTLLERNLVLIRGRSKAVGRPLLYTTAPEFLSYMGINDLGDLPELKELGTVLEDRERAQEEIGIEGAT